MDPGKSELAWGQADDKFSLGSREIVDHVNEFWTLDLRYSSCVIGSYGGRLTYFNILMWKWPYWIGLWKRKAQNDVCAGF